MVTIIRSKLAPTPGKSYRFAWRWLYTVIADGVEYSGDTLGWARRLARQKANGRPVVEAWQQ